MWKLLVKKSTLTTARFIIAVSLGVSKSLTNHDQIKWEEWARWLTDLLVKSRCVPLADIIVGKVNSAPGSVKVSGWIEVRQVTGVPVNVEQNAFWAGAVKVVYSGVLEWIWIVEVAVLLVIAVKLIEHEKYESRADQAIKGKRRVELKTPRWGWTVWRVDPFTWVLGWLTKKNVSFKRIVISWWDLKAKVCVRRLDQVFAV